MSSIQKRNDLIPEFLPAVPFDPFAAPNSPLLYELKDDGTPLIYSVSVNGIDDGGVPRRNFRMKGDLVWHYSLPDGLAG